LTVTVEDDILRVARERLQNEAEAVQRVSRTIDATFIRAARVLLETPGKVFIGGSGTSGTVARRMAHIFAVTGTPAVAFSPMDSLHGSSGAIGAGDLVVLISNGGASEEVLQAAQITRARGAFVLALTKSHETPLAQLADHSVVVSVEPGADIGGVIATGITIAQAAWGDALAEVLMRARGYTWREFMSTHPAGAVGQLDDLPEDLAPLRLPAAHAEAGPR
jgi:arabinose-5-phosphate isomerase